MTTNKTEKKMTKRDHFNALLNIPAVAENEGLVDFINHEIDLLNRKNSAEKKPTATQVANEGIKDTIMEVLTAEDGLMTVTGIIKANPSLSELTNQKVSALLRSLIEEGKVEKIVDKRKSYFRAL